MKKKKINIKNLILLLLELIFIIVFIFSLIKIIIWFVDSNRNKKVIDDINNSVIINDIEDNEKTEIIEQEQEINKENPYWDYIKMNLIDVNFESLKDKNSDTVGWIRVEGTNINYPFVQTNNNDYYLNHSFNKSYNSAGWVFLDYRNNIEVLDTNTIIYAHGRYDKTMFGSLRNVLTNGWLNNSNNYVIKLSTEAENTLWQVFSTYKIETTSDYLKTNFNTKEEYENFINLIVNRSQHNFNTTVNSNEKILTLSTCYDDNNKVVLHAKLIKKQAKNTLS